MLALLLSHWRPLALVAAILGAFIFGRCSAPVEQGEAEFIEVPVPTHDVTIEEGLRSQVADLQRQLAAAKSQGRASAHYTAPDGGSFSLECEAQTKQEQVCEVTQVVVQDCEQRVEVRETPPVVKPKAQGLSLWAGPVVLSKPFAGWQPEAGASLSADLGTVRAEVLVTNPIAPKLSPTVGASVAVKF